MPDMLEIFVWLTVDTRAKPMSQENLKIPPGAILYVTEMDLPNASYPAKMQFNQILICLPSNTDSL